jgi:hypothetical protein
VFFSWYLFKAKRYRTSQKIAWLFFDGVFWLLLGFSVGLANFNQQIFMAYVALLYTGGKQL